MAKEIKKLKSDGEITIRVPIVDWGEVELRWKYIAMQEIS